MGTTNWDIAQRWADVAMGTKPYNYTNNSRLMPRGDKIFSYGQWFEIGRVIRDKKGKPIRFLLNGDTWENRGGWGATNRHQDLVRTAVSTTKLPTVTVPYSVLDAAGIEKESVQIVEATQDGHEETNHVVYERPENTRWITVNDSAYVDKTDEEIEALLDDLHKNETASWLNMVQQAQYAYLNARKIGSSKVHVSLFGPDSWRFNALKAQPSPPVRKTRERLQSYQLRDWKVVGTHRELHFISRRTWGTRIMVDTTEDGRTQYSWTTYRHWLGESLIRGAIPRSVNVPCPAAKCTQGMIEGYPNAIVCGRCGGRAMLTVTKRRWAYFLSGFDHNEPTRSYFFCELPKGHHPKTVEEAYEILKPETVKLAEAMERQVLRQGDIFAIHMPSASKQSLLAQGAQIERMSGLLGTNHVATEVAYLGNLTFARGILWHKPQWRDPDHVRCHLGNRQDWYLITKNTVPVGK